MRVLVLGAKGFIGSAIVAEARRRGFDVVGVERGTYAAATGSACDLLVNASGNSRKYLDRQDPVAGYERSVTSVMRSLRDFRFGVYVQISSGALYPREGDPACNREADRLAPPLACTYGFHKWLAEQLVLQHAPRHLILRVGGAIGPGLRKNAVFDVLAGGALFVHPDSEFQFMDTRDIAGAVFDLAGLEAARNEVFNLCGRGTVSIRQIAGWAGKPLPPAAEDSPRVRSELNLDKVSGLLAMPGTAESVQRFVGEVTSGAVTLGAGERPGPSP
jgi:nucleoside-diphosphate-sugar epimerase